MKVIFQLLKYSLRTFIIWFSYKVSADNISDCILTEQSCVSLRLSSYGQYVIMLTTMFVTLVKVFSFAQNCLFKKSNSINGSTMVQTEPIYRR